jgi:hypothetical protein
MNNFWNTIIWQQFGAAIDMLENALQACPDELWRERVWDDTEEVQYGEFWFVVYHTLVWLDRYISGAPKDFIPPAPFIKCRLPEEPYTREALQAYLDQIRQKSQATLEGLTDEKATQICKFPWEGGMEISFAELQLYNMRHIQEHASQLSLHLGHKAGFAPDWVPKAGHKDG